MLRAISRAVMVAAAIELLRSMSALAQPADRPASPLSAPLSVPDRILQPLENFPLVEFDRRILTGGDLSALVRRNQFIEGIRENGFLRSRIQLSAPEDLFRDLRSTARVLRNQPTSKVTSVLEFGRRLTPALVRSLRTQGIDVEGFVGGSAYSVSIANDTALSDLMDRIDVPIVSGRVLTVADKLRANLQTYMSNAARFRRSEPVSFFVKVASGEDRQAIVAALRDRGAQSVEEAVPGTFVVRSDAFRAGSFAELGSVLAVDEGPTPFLPLLDRLRVLSRVDNVQRFALMDGIPHFDGLTGKNVHIAIFDNGVDESNLDFCPLDPGNGQHRFYRRDIDTVEICGEIDHMLLPALGSLHGTFVASVAGGSGINSKEVWLSSTTHLEPYSLRGVAPSAMLGEFSEVLERDVDPANFRRALVDSDTDVSNHSYVESKRFYGEMASIIDGYIAGNVSFEGEAVRRTPQVWAAGNNGVDRPELDASQFDYGLRRGYYSVFTQAKNSISVGSVDSAIGHVSAFSSLGPTFDGRIKPDLVAPGCHDTSDADDYQKVLGATNAFQSYVGDCGTSMAAPLVTGTIALMREALDAMPDGPVEVLPSTYKAILVATATDLVSPPGGINPSQPNPDTGFPLTYGRGPDFASGFGLVNTDLAVGLAADARHWREGIIVNAAVHDDMCLDIEADDRPLKVVLAWDDPSEGNADLSPGLLVNDLDMVLVDSSSNSHFPWTLAPLPISGDQGDIFGPEPDPISIFDIRDAERTQPDRLNNVELVEVDSPVSGRWQIKVIASHIGSLDGMQSYSIAADRAVVPCP